MGRWRSCDHAGPPFGGVPRALPAIALLLLRDSKAFVYVAVKQAGITVRGVASAITFVSGIQGR